MIMLMLLEHLVEIEIFSHFLQQELMLLNN